MKKTTSPRSLQYLFGALALLAASSCTPYQQQGAAVGALGGAGIGALAGNSSGDILTGAALGAAAGTGVTAYQEEQQLSLIHI